MKKMLTNNLGLKLLSVVFAIMLWLIVVNIDDPVISQDFSPIRVTMLNEDAVTSKDKVYKIEENSDIISVRVKAKRSVISKLSVEDFTATADMQKNIKLDNLVGIEVTCSNKNIKSSDITKSRENVVISIEDACTEQFNVVMKKTGSEGTGYVVGTMVPEQSLIQISGPASVIAKIKRVEARVNVNGVTSDRTVRCQLYLIDNNEEEMDTTYLEYTGKTDGIDVNITVLKKKTVLLTIGHTGEPADGYSFRSISYKPETVEIAGAEEDIRGISEIVVPDDAVNIDGITSNLQTTLDITEYLPSGIRLVDDTGTSVAVMVEIEKKQGKTIRIPVSEIGLKNMPKGLEADFGDLDEVEIIVMGTTAQLAELNPDEIAVNLNLSGYSKAGTYKSTLDVTLPDAYTLMHDVEIEFKLVKASSTGGNTGNGGNSGSSESSGGSDSTGGSGSSGGAGSSGGSSDGTGGGSGGNEGSGSSSGENTGNNTGNSTGETE